MKYKISLNLLIFIFLIYFSVKYIILKDEVMLFYGLITFSLSSFISIIIYMILFFDFRLKLRYVSLDEVSDETKAKIIKEQLQENKENEKNKLLKQFLYNLIYKQIYALSLFEVLIIIHYVITDISLLNKILTYTFPAFFALIITLVNLFKALIKKFH